jgi:hypothetical protein
VKKALLAERRPNGKREGIGIIVNGNLNVPANEKGLLVHDALIRCKLHALRKLALGNKRTPRSFNTKAKRNVILLNSAGVACPTHVMSFDQAGPCTLDREGRTWSHLTKKWPPDNSEFSSGLVFPGPVKIIRSALIGEYRHWSAPIGKDRRWKI